MFALAGVSFTDKQVRVAKRLLEKGHANSILLHLQDYPKFAAKFQAVKENITGLGIRDILERIAEKRLARCSCGKKEVTRFNRDKSPKACDQDFACPKYTALVVEKRRSTSRKTYGTDHPRQNKSVQEKAKKTLIRRYGVDNPGKNPEFNAKRAATNKERYGHENAALNDDVKAKTAATNMQRYGAATPFASEAVRAKSVDTYRERTGFDTPFHNPKSQRKAGRTNLERYGHRNPFGSEEIKKAISATNLERYGAANPFASEKIKRKIRRIMLETYGVDNPSKSPEVVERIREAFRERYGVEHALQHPDFFDKQSRSMRRYKVIRFNGRRVRVQGYEEKALTYMVNALGIDPDRIKISMEDRVKTVRYSYRGKERVYYPDFQVGKSIYEVKSTFTLYHNRELYYKTKAKAKACIKQGYKLRLILVDRKGAVKLPMSWLDKNYKEMTSWAMTLIEKER